MSQHSDLLSHSISKGIQRGDHANAVATDFAELLETLEYDETFTELATVKRHVFQHAKQMATQKDGLYGVSHAQLDKFITELWTYNQWLIA